MIYAPNVAALVGAVRRCEFAHWTSDQALEELQREAEEVGIGHIRWDHIDDRTFVGRSEHGYITIVTSVKLPIRSD